MQEQLIDTHPQQQPEQAQQTGFGTRAMNVFASPSELYQEVASTPVQPASWVIPLILSVLIGVIFTVVLFGNPTLRQQVLEPKMQEMQKQVEQGKMSQSDADRATSMMESSSMVMIFGVIAAAVGTAVAMFAIPLLLWLAVKIGFRSPVIYPKMLEVYGLSVLIGILGAVVTLLTMNLFNSFHATPGAGLLVMNNFDAHSFLHSVLASLSIFTIWQVAVVGVGIGKVAGKSAGAGIGLVAGLWLVWIFGAAAFSAFF